MTSYTRVPTWRLWLATFGPNTLALVLLWPLFLSLAVMTGSGLVLGIRPDSSGFSFRDPGFTGAWLFFLSGTLLVALGIVRKRELRKALKRIWHAGDEAASEFEAGEDVRAGPPEEAPPTGVLLVGTEVLPADIPRLYTSPAPLGARTVETFTAVRCEGANAAAAGIILAKVPFDESPPTMQRIPLSAAREAFRKANTELQGTNHGPARIYLAHVWEI